MPSDSKNLTRFSEVSVIFTLSILSSETVSEFPALLDKGVFFFFKIFSPFNFPDRTAAIIVSGSNWYKNSVLSSVKEYFIKIKKSSFSSASFSMSSENIYAPQDLRAA